MKTIQESLHYPGHGATAPFTICLRETGKMLFGKKEYVVHTRNDQDGGHYNGFYTTKRSAALDEFENRILKAGRLAA